MTLLIQRVLNALVTTPDQSVEIENGLLVYVSFHPDDVSSDLLKFAEKLAKLRIFDDGAGKMNLNVNEVKGSILIVPNFTLEADALVGNRPSFSHAKPFNEALHDFHTLADFLALKAPTQRGFFGANMKVESLNDGPVNIMIRSHDL